MVKSVLQNIAYGWPILQYALQYAAYDWLIVWSLTLFSTVFQLYCCGQYTYPCVPRVVFNQYSAQYSFQATGCFPTKPFSKQRKGVREEWILLQWLSSILRKNIGLAGIESATSCSQICNATDWAMGLGICYIWHFAYLTTWSHFYSSILLKKW